MIFLSIQHGFLPSILSLSIAILINFLFMIFTPSVNSLLEHLHILGSLIRLTGLIIAAVATQMVLSGISGFIYSITSH